MLSARGEQDLVLGRDLGGIVNPGLESVERAEDDGVGVEPFARVGDED